MSTINEENALNVTATHTYDYEYEEIEAHSNLSTQEMSDRKYEFKEVNVEDKLVNDEKNTLITNENDETYNMNAIELLESMKGTIYVKMIKIIWLICQIYYILKKYILYERIPKYERILTNQREYYDEKEQNNKGIEGFEKYIRFVSFYPP